MGIIRNNRGLVIGSVIAGAALAVGLAGAGVAANGGSLILGHANSATQTTTLTDTAGVPLSLRAPAGSAPLAVNSATRVPWLNADLLDGVDSSALQRKGATVRVSPPTYSPSTGPINRQARAYCLGGEHVIGGGAYTKALTADRSGEYYGVVVESAPIDTTGEPTALAGHVGVGWLAETTNLSGALGTPGDADLYAYAICAPN